MEGEAKEEEVSAVPATAGGDKGANANTAGRHDMLEPATSLLSAASLSHSSPQATQNSRGTQQTSLSRVAQADCPVLDIQTLPTADPTATHTNSATGLFAAGVVARLA